MSIWIFSQKKCSICQIWALVRCLIEMTIYPLKICLSKIKLKLSLDFIRNKEVQTGCLRIIFQTISLAGGSILKTTLRSPPGSQRINILFSHNKEKQAFTRWKIIKSSSSGNPNAIYRQSKIFLTRLSIEKPYTRSIICHSPKSLISHQMS